MIALIQRVSRAEVHIEQQRVAAIGAGVLALIGVRARRHAGCRRAPRASDCSATGIFSDAHGRMNLSVREVGAALLLLVPQFTLAADTHKGTRAGFSTAAPPEQAQRCSSTCWRAPRGAYAPVSAGVFGAHMQVSLVNDGPVTFWLETP